jgi:DNA polymerase-1
METEGINLDVPFKSMSSEMQKEIDTFEQKIYETAGEIQPSIT